MSWLTTGRARPVVAGFDGGYLGVVADGDQQHQWSVLLTKLDVLIRAWMWIRYLYWLSQCGIVR